MDQDAFIKHAKAQLDAWNAELQKMQERMEKATADGKTQIKAQIAAFEAQRGQAEKTLEKLGQANAAAWDDMQGGIQTAWTALEKSFADARKRYET
ncbi:MAG: hypothetical protein AAGF88_04555 [Pseudomonadota bacterium]